MATSEQLSRDELNHAVSHLIENIKEATMRLLNQPVENLHITVNNLLESWLIFTKQVLNDPDLASDAQIGYWQDYLSLCENLHQDLAMLKNSKIDNKEVILNSFVERFYILVSQHVHLLLKHIFDTANKDEGKEMESFYRQFARAMVTGGRIGESAREKI